MGVVYLTLMDGCLPKQTIPLPDGFLEWLQSDGMEVPPDTHTSIFFAPTEDSDDEVDWSEEGDSSSKPAATPSQAHFDFTALNRQVDEAIARLVGKPLTLFGLLDCKK